MDKKRKVLFLTAPYGHGHVQPTKVLAECLENKNIHTEIYDIIDEWSPHISKITQNIYKQMYRTGWRRLYQFWYWATDQRVASKIVTTFLKYTNRRNLKRAILEMQPDIIVCLFPAWALYKLLEDYEVDVPVYTVVTDFYMHKMWYHPKLSKIFVANAWTYHSANFQADSHKFIVTGIPIKADYEQQYAERIKDQEIQKTILLISGANGVSTQYMTLAKKLHNLDQNLKVILICGRNKQLLHKAMKLRRKLASSRFIVYGFRDDMIKQYEKADLVITKSGGNTVSELAALAKPAIFFDPLYGQEMANAVFFANYQVAKIAKTRNEVVSFIHELYENPDQILQMRQNYAKFFIADAASNIANEIEKSVMIHGESLPHNKD